jgi:hypothetical protein
MAYYTDGNGNYYCGQFSQQINYTYVASNLNIVNSSGTLRTDLSTIFGLLNYRYSQFNGTWTDGVFDLNALLYWKTFNDIDTTATRRSQMYNYYAGAGHFNTGGSLITYVEADVGNIVSYIVNQNGIISIKQNLNSLTIPNYRVIVNCELIDVNSSIPTNSSTGYYSSFYTNKLFSFYWILGGLVGQHRVEQTNTSNKPILLTSDAIYSITCNDGQTAGTDLWMTKLHVFDNTLRSNGVNSKYSRIGTVPNLAIGVGTSWIAGRIYEPSTNLFPGNNNKWLCVGTWNNLNDRFLLVNVWSA